MRTLNLFLLFFFLFALNSYSLPKCKGDDFKKWDNCKGTYNYKSGHKYVGEFKDGQPHGKGTTTSPDGDKYVGEHKDGQPHGKGSAFSPDGNKYVGEFKDDMYNGKGTFTFTDGKKYSTTTDSDE